MSTKAKHPPLYASVIPFLGMYLRNEHLHLPQGLNQNAPGNSTHQDLTWENPATSPSKGEWNLGMVSYICNSIILGG